MHWYNYTASFIAGVFIVNFFPHFVQGVSGKKFPTPFSRPPGVGLSSAGVNVLWSMFNLAFGIVLIYAGKVSPYNIPAFFLFIAGFMISGFFLGTNFEKNHEKRDGKLHK